MTVATRSWFLESDNYLDVIMVSNVDEKANIGDSFIILCRLGLWQLPGVWSHLYRHIVCSPLAQTFHWYVGWTEEDSTHFPVAHQKWLGTTHWQHYTKYRYCKLGIYSSWGAVAPAQNYFLFLPKEGRNTHFWEINIAAKTAEFVICVQNLWICTVNEKILKNVIILARDSQYLRTQWPVNDDTLNALGT